MDWIDDTAETWTYVSANQFKITGNDKAKKYPVGCKIRLKQGGDYKYFFVTHRAVDGSFTYIDVVAGIEYSLTNSSITDTYHSYGETADGFPEFFSYSPNWTATSGTAPSVGNGTLVGYFTMSGQIVFFVTGLTVGTTTGVGNGGQWRFALPTIWNDAWPMTIGQAYFLDNGVAAYEGVLLADSGSTFRPSGILTSGTYAQHSGVTQTVPFSWGNTDAMLLQGFYHTESAVQQL